MTYAVLISDFRKNVFSRYVAFMLQYGNMKLGTSSFRHVRNIALHMACDRLNGQKSASRVAMVLALAMTGRVLPVARAESYFMPPAVPARTPVRMPASTSLPSPATPQPASRETDYYVTAPHLSLKPQASDALRHVGPFNIEQSDTSPIPMETGRTITAAYPVRSVPGLDFTINMFAGHRDTNTGSNVGMAALTAGVRIKW